MKPRILALCCTCAMSLFAAYSFAFFVWVSATPLSEDQLRRVKYDQLIWLVLLLAFALSSVFLLINAILFAKRRNQKKREARGFEVVLR